MDFQPPLLPGTLVVLVRSILPKLFGTKRLGDSLRANRLFVYSIVSHSRRQISLMEKPRSFLFLQGPYGAFFRLLADRLEQEGHKCYKIHVCLSDWYYWRRHGGAHFRGSVHQWSGFLKEYFQSKSITDLVLLGERRVHHKIAIELAETLGIRVTVTDFGYLRPDWITVEKHGMTGDSLFPRDIAAIQALASRCTEPEFSVHFNDSFAGMSWHVVSANILNSVFSFLYPSYETHLLDHPIVCYVSTGLRMLWKRTREAGTKSLMQRLFRERKQHPFFLFPMQMEGDFSLTAYSPFESIADAVELAVTSFARNAPKSHRLVFKLHPFDTGMIGWGRLMRRLADEHGLQDRLFVIDGGSIDTFLKYCVGVVLVNSTSGFAALRHGKPLHALGQAIYDLPGVTFQGNLDNFWEAPPLPSPQLVDDLIRAVAGCLLVRGAFYNNEGLAVAVQGTVRRLLEDKVNQPMDASLPEGGEVSTTLP